MERKIRQKAAAAPRPISIALLFGHRQMRLLLYPSGLQGLQAFPSLAQNRE